MSGQFAVFREFVRTIEHVPAAFVSKSLLFQVADKIDDHFHVLRDPRIGCGARNPETIQILVVGLNEHLSHFGYGQVHFFRFANQFIVHICKVYDVIYIILLILQVTAHHVKKDHRPRVPNMNITVDGRSANIHLHFSGRQADELFLGAG
ncbi:hypothetical protein D3C81_1172260 [compost metagenome]